MNASKIIELKKINDFNNYITDNDESKILENFKYILQYENRFFNENHPVFVCVKNLFDKHTIILSQNEILFRARKIEADDEEKVNKEEYFEEYFYGYNKKDSFVPQAKKIPANRANAMGIPCLYAAREEKTAIAEIRPFLGQDISVAIIRPLRDLKIFDLFIDPNLSYNEIEKKSSSSLWFGIAILFSFPYEKSTEKEYLLTQCISEYIKISGFDGIQYSSSLNEGGKNIALFNCKNEDDGGKYDICEPISSNCCTLNRIEYSCEIY